MLDTLACFNAADFESSVLGKRFVGELARGDKSVVITCQSYQYNAKEVVEEVRDGPLNAMPVARRRWRYVARTTERLEAISPGFKTLLAMNVFSISIDVIVVASLLADLC